MYTFVTCKCIIERRQMTSKEFKERIKQSGEFEFQNTGNDYLKWKSKDLCSCCNSPYYFSDLFGPSDMLRIASYHIREDCKTLYNHKMIPKEELP